MRIRKKRSVAVAIVAASLALALLIYVENFVVPVNWIQTHETIHSLIVLTCLQPVLVWFEWLSQEQKPSN
jgi:hypothetical protein